MFNKPIFVFLNLASVFIGIIIIYGLGICAYIFFKNLYVELPVLYLGLGAEVNTPRSRALNECY